MVFTWNRASFHASRSFQRQIQNWHKKRSTEASGFKVGSWLNLSNLEMSEIISWIALSESFWYKMITQIPLCGFVITISLFFLRFCKIWCWIKYTWRRFVLVKIRIRKIWEMCFYLTFAFLRFKAVKKRTMNPFKGKEDLDFLSG